MRTVARFCPGLALLVVAISAATAEPLSLEVRDCAELDIAVLRELLSVEIRSLSSSVETPRVGVSCAEGSIHLELVDREAEWHIERTITAPAPDDPQRERIVAIAASEMLLAWRATGAGEGEPGVNEPAPEHEPALEHEPDSEHEPDPEPTPAAAPDPVPVPTPEPSPRAATPPPRRSATLAHLGVRLRGASDPVGTLRGELRQQLPVTPRLTGDLGVAYEEGRVARDLGDVSTRLIGIGLGARWEPVELRAGYLRLGGTLRGLATRVRGHEAASGAVADVQNRASVEAEATLGAGFRSDVAQVGVELAVGGALPTIQGRVEGERSVVVHGPYLGAALVAGLRF